MHQTHSSEGLYDPRFEHDACGVGFIADLNNVRSHEIVEKGIEILQNLDHRGARGAEKETGDGAGILVQVPHAFFLRECAQLGISLPEPGGYAVGQCFLPKDPRTHVGARSTSSGARSTSSSWRSSVGARSPPTTPTWAPPPSPASPWSSR